MWTAAHRHGCAWPVMRPSPVPRWPHGRVGTAARRRCPHRRDGLINRVTDQSGGAITRTQLEPFTFDGHNIKATDHTRGIPNPAIRPATLSILTNPRSGYQDQIGPDGFPRYSIRTGDWAQGDNRKLHAAFAGSITRPRSVYVSWAYVFAHPQDTKRRPQRVSGPSGWGSSPQRGTFTIRRSRPGGEERLAHDPRFRFR